MYIILPTYDSDSPVARRQPPREHGDKSAGQNHLYTI